MRTSTNMNTKFGGRLAALTFLITSLSCLSKYPIEDNYRTFPNASLKFSICDSAWWFVTCVLKSKCLPTTEINAPVEYELSFGRIFFSQCRKLRSFHCAFCVTGSNSKRKIVFFPSKTRSMNTVLNGLNLVTGGLLVVFPLLCLKG